MSQFNSSSFQKTVKNIHTEIKVYDENGAEIDTKEKDGYNSANTYTLTLGVYHKMEVVERTDKVMIYVETENVADGLTFIPKLYIDNVEVPVAAINISKPNKKGVITAILVYKTDAEPTMSEEINPWFKAAISAYNPQDGLRIIKKGGRMQIEHCVKTYNDFKL